MILCTEAHLLKKQAAVHLHRADVCGWHKETMHRVKPNLTMRFAGWIRSSSITSTNTSSHPRGSLICWSLPCEQTGGGHLGISPPPSLEILDGTLWRSRSLFSRDVSCILLSPEGCEKKLDNVNNSISSPSLLAPLPPTPPRALELYNTFKRFTWQWQAQGNNIWAVGTFLLFLGPPRLNERELG